MTNNEFIEKFRQGSLLQDLKKFWHSYATLSGLYVEFIDNGSIHYIVSNGDRCLGGSFIENNGNYTEMAKNLVTRISGHALRLLFRQ